MRIMTLLGSARTKGNTATVLGWVEQELERRGHDVVRVDLNRKAIGGCLGCGKCRETPDDIACVQEDDANPIMMQMIAADSILFASPVYFWGFSAPIKALIDRGYAFVTNYHRPGHTSLLQGRRIGLLVTGGGAYENNAEGLFNAFDRLDDFLLTRKAGTLFVGSCTTPAELPERVKAQAMELAASLVD